MSEETVFEIEKELLRESLCKYTRRAFQMLPKLDKPRILDIGCGSGGPTLELARLSQGEIIGIDIHQPSLDRLSRKIEQAGLSGRVKAVNCSMFNMDFADESFDIIWAEGSTFIIGFERALKEWRRFLKPKGFLVVHEMTWSRPDPPQEVYNYWKGLAASGIRTVPEYLEQIPACGYDVIGYFALPEDAFWIEYYGPLERRIKELRAEYIDDPKALAILDKEQHEIDIAKKYHEWYGSAFFVMQKR
jgi:SAM-dependent methyltransferase